MPPRSLNLDESSDPIALFGAWLEEAGRTEPNDPNAVALATVDRDGMPDVRMVLLKDHGFAGFTFYTNRESRKGEELAGSAKAALCFHWKTLGRQVRVRGTVSRVDDADSDRYFASRHPTSRRGAWASAQSRPLASRSDLEEALAEIERRFPDDDAIPRPPYWSGFRVEPAEIELWQDGANRLHDRFRFTRRGEGWQVERLYP